MNASVSIAGDREVRAMLQQFMEPQMTKRAKRATKKGADVLKRPLRAAARPLSKRMAAAVYVHLAKRDRPAHVLGARRRKAFFWHMVIGGTKDHGPRRAPKLVFIPGWNPYSGVSSRGVGNKVIRTSRVRGVPPHPIVAQVASRYGDLAMKAMIDDLTKEE